MSYEVWVGEKLKIEKGKFKADRTQKCVYCQYLKGSIFRNVGGRSLEMYD